MASGGARVDDKQRGRSSPVGCPRIAWSGGSRYGLSVISPKLMTICSADGGDQYRQRRSASTWSSSRSAAACASLRRTARKASSSSGPSAAVTRGLAFSAASCASCVAGRASIPRSARCSRRPRSGVGLLGFAQRQPFGEAGGARGEQRGQRQVRVGRGVGRLQLDVGVVRPEQRRPGHVAQRRLPVLHAPEAVRAGEVARSQPGQRPEAGGGDRGQRGQVAQQPGEVARALARAGRPGRRPAGSSRRARSRSARASRCRPSSSRAAGRS